MVYKAVYHRCGHLVIREDASPFGEFNVRCQYQTFLLITVRDHAEQQLGAFPVYRDITPLIQDQKIQRAQFFRKRLPINSTAENLKPSQIAKKGERRFRK